MFLQHAGLGTPSPAEVTDVAPRFLLSMLLLPFATNPHAGGDGGKRAAGTIVHAARRAWDEKEDIGCRLQLLDHLVFPPCPSFFPLFSTHSSFFSFSLFPCTLLLMPSSQLTQFIPCPLIPLPPPHSSLPFPLSSPPLNPSSSSDQHQVTRVFHAVHTVPDLAKSDLIPSYLSDKRSTARCSLVTSAQL